MLAIIPEVGWSINMHLVCRGDLFRCLQQESTKTMRVCFANVLMLVRCANASDAADSDA